jgi:long-chain acyl-CoA synthetase
MGILSDAVGISLAKSQERAIQFKGEWITWGQLGRLIRALDATMAALDLPQGAAVGGVLRNWPEHVAMLVGVVAGEKCLVTFNGLLPDEKLCDDLRQARPPVVVAHAADWARPAVRSAVEEIGAAGISLTGDWSDPVRFVEGLSSIGPQPHQETLPEIGILMLTSGTTGKPKRVPLRAAVIERQLAEAAGGQRYNSSDEKPPPQADATIMFSSLVHISGVWGTLGAAMAGRPIVLMEKFTVPEWRAAVLEHRPKSGGGPPAALRMILDADLPKEDLASFVSLGAGAAALSPAVVDEFLERYDLPVLTNYGATEFAGGVASWSLRAFREHWAAKRGAVGRVHKGIEARIVDPATGQETPLGVEGILELRGFAVGDGWVRTTDRGVLDADRFLWIRGRADNAINRGGFKVQPEEVVAVLQGHPSIREASVVGVPDRRLGETPVAAFVVAEGASRPSDAELVELIRAKLAPYCVPVAFKAVPELPRTPSMKISMPGVRELFAELERA